MTPARRSPAALATAACVVVGLVLCSAASGFGFDTKGANPFPPYRAGLKLSIGEYNCTSGFAVADSISGRYYGLTAGHCAAHGTVRVAGRRVGQVLGSRFLCCDVVTSDSALLTVPQDQVTATIANVPQRGGLFAGLLQASALRHGQVTQNIPVTGYLADSAFARGMKLCSLGAFGWLRCGRVTRLHYSYRFHGGRRITGLVCARFPVRSGDSGGPVFELDGDHALAAGLVSLGGRYSTCFSPIEDALSAWDVELLVPGADGVTPLDPGAATQAPPASTGFKRPPDRRCGNTKGARHRLSCLLERAVW